MNDDAFAPVSGAGGRPTVSPKAKWVSVMPIPEDAPPPPPAHPTLGKPSGIWPYHGSLGAVLGYHCRFDGTGGKQFRPLTLWRSTAGSRLAWRWESWPTKRPLYGLHRLAERPSAPVVVCEGEKAADAATLLLQGFVAITSPNGSKSASKADWSVLNNRAVTVWPDADEAGFDYARQVAKLVTAAGARSVAIVPPPTNVEAGWDAADALADGWATERAVELLNGAMPAEKIAGNKTTAAEGDEKFELSSEPTGRRRTPQRDVLIRLISLTEFVELWHDANRTAYATFPVSGHVENWQVRSRDFRMWLSGRFFEETGAAIGGQALEDGLRILEARAVNDGPLHECFIRTGAKMYLDCGDATWRAVEISADGWTVIDRSPIKLLRSPSMRALPEPEAGCLVEEEFRRFINVKSEDDFLLVVAWLAAAFRPHGPFPIIVLNGEAGSGKSVFSRMLRSLIDPSAAPIRAVPRDDRDLVVSASNSWLLAFDNLSSVPTWLADAFCRLATGSGFATRKLHTDCDEMIFEAARPIIINGIPHLTDRADLADRSVTIHLSSIPDADRRPEDELLADFAVARPRILGRVARCGVARSRQYRRRQA
jgi:hypothetical protein